ncbi:helix-turn-helix domain-containing protein [Pseudonocardia benzenivorans]
MELARLRRAAIEEARDQLGGSYTEVAKAFGLTKGRITQIRNSAPPAHRAFFGVGPSTSQSWAGEFSNARTWSSPPRTTPSAVT